MNQINNACAKLSSNINEVNDFVGEQALSDTEYHKMQYKAEQVKVILEFPKQEDRTNQIRQEVREILRHELLNQLKKLS